MKAINTSNGVMLIPESGKYLKREGQARIVRTVIVPTALASQYREATAEEVSAWQQHVQQVKEEYSHGTKED